MPTPGQKTKKKKFRRTISGKSKVFFTRKKTAKRKCGLCGNILHGVPHGKTRTEVRKLSKSQRTPSVVFGGVLCSGCRSRVVEDAVKVNINLKEIGSITPKERAYVQIMQSRTGK